ncbi:MAG TPA: hypothetical protein VNA30_03710 [Mycobacteriales bacterium]|nr:hypothetical protein [Mycobacteriales bacterium]
MATLAKASPRSLYLYVVCLVALVMSIFAAVGVARSVVELLYPEPGSSYPIYAPEGPALAPGSSQPAPRRPSQEEIEREEERQRDFQRRQGVLGLVGNGTMLLIAGPAYLYHWRRVREETAAAEAAVPAAD